MGNVGKNSTVTDDDGEGDDDGDDCNDNSQSHSARIFLKLQPLVTRGQPCLGSRLDPPLLSSFGIVIHAGFILHDHILASQLTCVLQRAVGSFSRWVTELNTLTFIFLPFVSLTSVPPKHLHCKGQWDSSPWLVWNAHPLESSQFPISLQISLCRGSFSSETKFAPTEVEFHCWTVLCPPVGRLEEFSANSGAVLVREVCQWQVSQIKLKINFLQFLNPFHFFPSKFFHFFLPIHPDPE